MKIFELFVAFIVTKFLPHKRLVDAYPVSTDLDHATLTAAVKLYKFHSTGRLNACGQVVQLFHSENPAFSSLGHLIPVLTKDLSFGPEKQCAHALGMIMQEVDLQLKSSARV